jgi:hypothetical protein
VAQLTGIGVPLDLVLCYRDPGGDVSAWAAFVAQVVARHGQELAAVQVTGEPNLTWVPGASGFWVGVRDSGGEQFAAAVDYAGIDIYPDVFGPRISPDELPAAVEWLLRTFRERDLATAGIAPSVPIRICENGWPTGPDRPEEQQAIVLERIVRTVHALRTDLSITHWELFTLRDADSSKNDLFHRFGVLRDDYSPKPAFHTLRRLISDLG